MFTTSCISKLVRRIPRRFLCPHCLIERTWKLVQYMSQIYESFLKIRNILSDRSQFVRDSKNFWSWSGPKFLNFCWSQADLVRDFCVGPPNHWPLLSMPRWFWLRVLDCGLKDVEYFELWNFIKFFEYFLGRRKLKSNKI